MDKFFSHLAVDAALDQTLLYLTPEELAGEVRVMIWLAVMCVQLFLVRRWVLSWAGLEPDAQSSPALETVPA